jgi:N-acetylglucosaminyldiphosphoundecaprenol N-acetyl-beta-D-mannosaminyltransferase
MSDLPPTAAATSVTEASRPSPAAAAPQAPAAVELLGLRMHRVTRAEALAFALDLGRRGRPALILTPNADHVLRARRDPWFRAVYAAADLVVADGQSVVWASRLLGRALPERVAGSDLMPELCVAAARAGMRFFFVGGAPGDAMRAAQVLAQRAGSDGCAGVDCPPLGFERDPSYVDGLVARIAAARPHFLFVGLGSPKQELLMAALRDRLDAGAMMGVGVTFSFVAGTVKRAPHFVRRVGFEWLWRLACEPRRLWRRYLDNLVSFPWLVLRERLR